jgi:hypothetical protein
MLETNAAAIRRQRNSRQEKEREALMDYAWITRKLMDILTANSRDFLLASL